MPKGVGHLEWLHQEVSEAVSLSRSLMPKGVGHRTQPLGGDIHVLQAEPFFDAERRWSQPGTGKRGPRAHWWAEPFFDAERRWSQAARVLDVVGASFVQLSRSLMPKGVGHREAVISKKVSKATHLSRSLMPKGVGHSKYKATKSLKNLLSRSLMPKGVGHIWLV